jgi:putative nucleotidyltransferase with HDIG domain
MFFSTVWSLASAVDAKDAYTHGHSQRVAKYSSTLGRALGFDDREIERLELSAILHDVGKIGVPEAILNKPDRLTAAEMAVMRTHPEKGAEILSTIRAMRDIVPGVLHHHERFDGCGYPSGLKGENIPLQARIILISDTFDAMTSTRPYRKALPVQAAIDEIRKCSGTQFDPRLAEVFVDLVERGLIRPIESTETLQPASREGVRP